MIEKIWDFFDSAGLMPHGVCFLWREDLVYLHFFSDLAIAGAYLSLPVFLLALVRRKPELKTGGIVPLFALFIFFCALAHMFSMWTLWVPDYLAQGVAKFATAVVSVFTAIMVWPLLPKIAAMPSTQQLMNSNRNLDENREFLNVVLDSVEDGIVACDADGNLKIFNRITRELHGLPAEHLPPEKWAEYYDLYEADGTTPLEMERIPLFRALRGEVVEDAEMVIRPKGCPPRQLLATGRALTDADGQKLGAVVSMHDVTDQRNAEAARELAEEALRRTQRMEAIGQMTGGIAHDFNNLLGVITGNLEFLQRMVGDDEASAKRVNNALSAAIRGSKLTRRLLNVSSQEARPGTASDANAVLANLEDILAKSLTSEIEVEIHPAADLWQTEIDPGDLGDAILNLALNARDAMPDGGKLVIETENQTVTAMPEFYVGAREMVIPGEYVVVMVSDTGVGIAEDVLEKAFEPFFTTKPEGRGTGLGLSMVYAFAKRSRGDVRIYSEPGHGTTVRIFLPRSHAELVSPADNLKGQPGPVSGGTETVLVVDDEPGLLEIADSMLRELGYTTVIAGNGQEAMNILKDDRDHKIDLVFSDVIMPGGIGGFELAAAARALRPKIKVLLASGFTGKLADKQVSSDLIRSIVYKPYDKARLAWAVRAVLDRLPGGDTMGPPDGGQLVKIS